MQKSADASNMLVPSKQLQQQIEDIPAPKEEIQPPVIKRVSKKSDKDSYQMYDIKYYVLLTINLFSFITAYYKIF